MANWDLLNWPVNEFDFQWRGYIDVWISKTCWKPNSYKVGGTIIATVTVAKHVSVKPFKLPTVAKKETKHNLQMQDI